MDKAGISDLWSKVQSRRPSGLTKAEDSHRAALGKWSEEIQERWRGRNGL